MERDHFPRTTAITQDVEEDERFVPADVVRSMYGGENVDWWEKLRTAETEADFDVLKRDIITAIHEPIFHAINSPEVLRACLRHMQLGKEALLKAAYQVASRHRIDLLDVFFSGYLTWEEFSNSNSFSYYVDSVLVGGHVDVMNFLLDKGLSVDHKFRHFHTCPLAVACHYGKVDVIDLLLSRGADVNKKIAGGATAAFRAMYCGDPTVLDRLFLYGADLFHCNDKGQNLWSSTSSFDCYRSERITMMLHLTKYRVPLDRETYNSKLQAYRYNRLPELRKLLGAMRELLISQGEEVEEIPA